MAEKVEQEVLENVTGGTGDVPQNGQRWCPTCKKYVDVVVAKEGAGCDQKDVTRCKECNTVL